MSIINPESGKDVLTGATTNVAKTTGLAAVLTSVATAVVSILTGIEADDVPVKIAIIAATAFVLAAAAIAWAIVAAADLRARATGEATRAAASRAQDSTVLSLLQEAGAGVDRCLEIVEDGQSLPSLHTVLSEVCGHLTKAQRQSGDSSTVAKCAEMANHVIDRMPPTLSEAVIVQRTKEELMELRMRILRATVFVINKRVQ